MHQTKSQDTPHSSERRCCSRQRPSSIIYIELDSGNGGIVTSLGVGGLAFQAARKLAVEPDLTLKFRLREAGQSIEIFGGIAWLAPTQREAGLYFKDLPNDLRDEIAEWIDKQNKGYEATASASTSVSIPRIFARRMPATPHATNPVAGADKSPSQGPLDTVSRASGASPEVAAPNPQPSIRPDGFAYSDTHPLPSIERPSELPPESSPRVVLPEPTKTTPASEESRRKDADIRNDRAMEELRKRQWVLPESLSPSRKVVTATQAPSPVLVTPQTRERLRRNPLMLAGFAACLGILVLILTVAHIAGSRGSSSLQQNPAASTPFSVAGSSQPPIPPVQAAVPPRVSSHSAWSSFLRALLPGFYDDAKPAINQDQAGVHVWVSKRSGYYYCSPSADYGTAQPGALMTQGEALQSGYQPKLGDLCY